MGPHCARFLSAIDKCWYCSLSTQLQLLSSPKRFSLCYAIALILRSTEHCTDASVGQISQFQKGWLSLFSVHGYKVIRKILKETNKKKNCLQPWCKLCFWISMEGDCRSGIPELFFNLQSNDFYYRETSVRLPEVVNVTSRLTYYIYVYILSTRLLRA